MRPLDIPANIAKYLDGNISLDEMCKSASEGYAQLSGASPEVSIVIPAYNEENNIVPTLMSLCTNKTERIVEIIVVNNNSQDRTEELTIACGVKCVFQPVQGITVSRNMGLSNATGTYILNADADSIYPEHWIENMIKPLEHPAVAMTYGRFSLIPTANTGRSVYFFYEYIAEFSRWVNKFIKDEAVNVYGFNSGFRRKEGLEVNGFDHPPGTNEDGWLAVKLRDKGFGRLELVKEIKALVWTTDRRIQMDGGLVSGVWKRLKRVLLKR
ncbi:glycosyltransferase family 2 protein [Pedobacter frigoris]|uniref:glycosyltransferase family 2 protein n=1 Tax=Pedobacter frigoris TaxID=2571272 RepID=UPI0029307732|nr:glycosyltransferase family 2 protein [Pedobacter frigoris]